MQTRKPKLGQNFLIDDGARHRIVDALGDIQRRTVVEIGPGHGSLTTILAGRAAKLICIELDRALAAELRFRFREHANVVIVEADVLATDLTGLVSSGEKAIVVGNLPYYITSDILMHLCRAEAALESAVVMMQREVADRVAATPNRRDYGLLSVSVQMHARVTSLFTLPPSAFAPSPDVCSTVLRLQFAPRFESLGITDPAAFESFLKACFAQKRKTLRNNLRAAGYTSEAATAAFERSGVSASARAEELALEQFVALFHAL